MEPRKSTVIRVQNGPFDFSQAISTVTALAQALVISWLVSLIYQTWELQLPNSIDREAKWCEIQVLSFQTLIRLISEHEALLTLINAKRMGENGQGNLLEWEGRISF